MKLFHIMALSFCMSTASIQAMDIAITPQPKFQELLEQVSKGFKDTPSLISQLAHNMGLISAGTIVGSIGAYLFGQGLSGLIDKSFQENDKDRTQYKPLLTKAVIGASLMCVAGYTVKTFIK